jgi:stage V sporulation protein G
MAKETNATPQTAAPPLQLDFSVRPVTPKDNFLGFAKVTINKAVVLDGLRILQSEKGIYAGMPSVPDGRKEGTYRDIAYPITPEARAQINQELGAAYTTKIEQEQARMVAILANQKNPPQTKPPSIKQQLAVGKKRAAEQNGQSPSQRGKGQTTPAHDAI